MSYRSIGWTSLLLALTLVAVGPARAESNEDNPVRLYTNADLAKLEPIPSQAEPIVQTTEDWSFVTDFIRRQHEQIDAERAHDLERYRTEAEVGYLENRRPRYTLPLNGFYNYGFRHRFDDGDRIDHRRRALIRRGHTDVSGRIAPLHSRPSSTQVRYFKAARRSGAAAMPSRPPRRN